MVRKMYLAMLFRRTSYLAATVPFLAGVTIYLGLREPAGAKRRVT